MCLWAHLLAVDFVVVVVYVFGLAWVWGFSKTYLIYVHTCVFTYACEHVWGAGGDQERALDLLEPEL